MTTRERIANRLITEAVADYRAASAALRAKPGQPAFRDTQSSAAGKLDVLFQLFPRLPAWADTKWIH